MSTEGDKKDSLYEKLCDAHCHAHDDMKSHDRIPRLQAGHITLMGVRQDDWETVTDIAQKCNQVNTQKCVPCYGIHPWFSFRVMAPKSTISADEHYLSILKTQDMNKEVLNIIHALEPPFPFDVWHTRLRQHLVANPNALVGEVGVDRSARLMPGGSIQWQNQKPTTIFTRIEHQISILRAQLDLAQSLNRAVSVHCVQGQGHLMQLLQQHGKTHTVPMRICFHSFGGSPETLPQLLSLKGYYVYVSYSITINGRLSPKKLDDLIQKVPDDQILLESDLNTPIGLEEALVAIAHKVGEAKGWTLEQVIEKTHANWKCFVNNT